MVESSTTTQATVVLVSGLVLVGCGLALALIAMVRIGFENNREKQDLHSHRAD